MRLTRLLRRPLADLPVKPSVSLSGAQLARSASSRRTMVEAALEAAAKDAIFGQLVLSADAARDSSKWGEARELYQNALHRWPLHPGYTVQLGHMHKELGEFRAASFFYRRALALGQTDSDTVRHFVFAAERAKTLDSRVLNKILAFWLKNGESAPLEAPPITEDANLLVLLFLGRSEPDLVERILLECELSTKAPRS